MHLQVICKLRFNYFLEIIAKFAIALDQIKKTVAQFALPLINLKNIA